MTTTDLLTRWSALSLEEIESELQAGAQLETAEQLFGVEDVAEMRAIAASRPVAGRREAVVLLPGLMGSLLSSIRGLTALLWINPGLVARGQSRYLELNQEGTGDGSPLISSVPSGLEKLCYLKMSLALRRAALLFEFPYDWRRPIEFNAGLLGQAIERWADGDAGLKFTLVGHSMGGLVARAYLALSPDLAEQRVARLITLGTPHFGAAGAVSDIMLGNRMMAIATRLNEANQMRRLIMNLPSVYQLLPAPPELFPAGRPYPADWDLYDASQWRLQGVRQDYLDGGRRFHELLARSTAQVETSQIAGCHLETTTDVRRAWGAGEQPQMEVIRQEEGPDSGDTTVPLWSARLPGAAVYYVQQVHRHLARDREVIQATLDLIHGEKPRLPAALPPRKAGILGSFRSAGPPEAAAERLRANIATGALDENDLAELYFLSA